MEIDVTQKLADLAGNPLKDENGEELMLRTVCVNALLAMTEDDKTLSGEDKLKAWQLASRIQGEDRPDIETGEEIDLLKKRIGKVFGTIVVGPALMILNGTPASK